MKSFEYQSPSTLEEALELMPRGRGASVRDSVKLMAGGQDLLTELQDHLVEPERVVNLKRIGGLDRIAEGDDGSVAIGALVTIAELAESLLIAERFPGLAEAAESIGSPQIRNVGTVGGNLCQRPRCWYYRNEAVPCLKKGGSQCYAYGGNNKYNAILGGGPSYIVHPSDLAPMLVALDAEVTVRGREGERTLTLERFFTLPSEGSVMRENVLAQDEIVTGVTLPRREGPWRSTYVKFRERSSFDWALASVALAMIVDGDVVREARVCLGGVAPIPWRAAEAERFLAGRKVDAATCAGVGERALEGADPLEQNGYKVPLARGLLTRALRELARG